MAFSELTIRQLGPQGDGVSLSPRGPVFVDRTVPGDRVKARLYKDKLGVNRGEVTRLLEPSPYRAPAPCKHYHQCGNCTLQHLKETYYRRWKPEMVRDAFLKQRLEPKRWLPPIFLGGQNRRRATLNATKIKGRIVLGYYRRRSQEISDIDSCLVADPKILEIRNALKPFLAPILIEGEKADVFLQLVGDAIDLVVTGPVGRQGRPDVQVRKSFLAMLDALNLSRVSWRESEKHPIEVIGSRSPVVGTFGKLKVHLPPFAFLQPTAEGEKALVKAVMSALPAQGNFADLFSGCGTFSGPLVERGAVDAYDSVPTAVTALDQASKGLRLRAFRRDLFRSPLRRDEINRYDAVVFDPPRAGCAEQALAMTGAKTPVLLGVSCNPATFARDARVLCQGGYRLESLQVIDQFQWSHHVEIVGVFSKGRQPRH